MLDELGQKTAVIDMGVGEDDPIDRCGVKGKRSVVPFFSPFVTLKQTAINEELSTLALQQEAGTCHLAGGPMEN
jgi:hypothetical protein